jgi:hypothetical protein
VQGHPQGEACQYNSRIVHNLYVHIQPTSLIISVMYIFLPLDMTRVKQATGNPFSFLKSFVDSNQKGKENIMKNVQCPEEEICQYNKQS